MVKCVHITNLIQKSRIASSVSVADQRSMVHLTRFFFTGNTRTPSRRTTGVLSRLKQHPSKMAANGSSTASKSSNNAGGKPTGPTAEQVVGNFQRMRQEQRGMASKASEFEMENNEHSLVIETLKEVDPSRKCFRLVGGVLVERTVKEVLPALENNKEQITKIIETLSSQMQTKGRELTEYREKYNIRLVGEGEGEGQSADSRDSEGGASKGGTGVLVS
uniref:Prefoldin subunit 2 n=1 Tax=Gadus morhua TaxID=8049 RepID=A0A8C5BSR1_GADMO